MNLASQSYTALDTMLPRMSVVSCNGNAASTLVLIWRLMAIFLTPSEYSLSGARSSLILRILSSSFVATHAMHWNSQCCHLVQSSSDSTTK